MLDLPIELFTPFLPLPHLRMERHRIEELVNGNKIIRPAYMSVAKRREYIPLADRTQ
jgi:hypothetical protein